jgi:hypothetical protein
MQVLEVNGLRALELPAEGPLLLTEQDALDIIGETYGKEIDLVIIPVARLSPEFFVLRNRHAGGFIQKLITYRLRVAFVGDISAQVAASSALRDFVYESNKSGTVAFTADRAALSALLG